MPDSVLCEWCDALEASDVADAIRSGEASNREKAISVVLEHCEKYRDFDVTNEEIVDIFVSGASRAKYLLRETLSNIKSALGVSEIIE